MYQFFLNKQIMEYIQAALFLALPDGLYFFGDCCTFGVCARTFPARVNDP